jgi:hypothetical protein
MDLGDMGASGLEGADTRVCGVGDAGCCG